MNFIIGDIHGELTKLKRLVDAILKYDAKASLIFIGDYLDKGEDPYKTLIYLTELKQKKACIFLRGNHEYYWELVSDNQDEYASYLLKYGGRNTIDSVKPGASIMYVKEKLFSEFETFFGAMVNYSEIGNFIATHSGIPPALFNNKIEEITPKDLLFNRYSFIEHKQKYHGRTVVFGHTGFYHAYYDGYKIGIDTAACYLEAQPLTSFCVEAESFIDSNNSIYPLKSLDLTICPVIPRVKAWRQK